MRWKDKQPKPDPKPGDTRVVKKFLLLPLTVDGETRWLEWAWVKQVYGAVEWWDREWAEPQTTCAKIVVNIDWGRVDKQIHAATKELIDRDSRKGVNEKPQRPDPPE